MPIDRKNNQNIENVIEFGKIKKKKKKNIIPYNVTDNDLKRPA